MRLVDADALKDNMFGYAPPEMTWDRGDIEHKIDEQPTIDAIPVEWLQEKMQKPQTTCANPFGFVLAEWLEEQEART